MIISRIDLNVGSVNIALECKRHGLYFAFHNHSVNGSAKVNLNSVPWFPFIQN